MILRRQDAQALGLSKYFTGKACANGHRAERYTSSGQCVECAKSAARITHNRTWRLVLKVDNDQKRAILSFIKSLGIDPQ